MGAQPIIEGTESIVSQDVKYLWGVEQKTALGVVVDLFILAVGASGLSQAIEKAVAKVVGGKLAEYLVDDVFSLISTSESVNIELNRYILRSADGNKRFQVYATYRKLDGSFIDAKIVQQGII